MDKKAMLEELINHFTDGNKSKFANIISVKPQTINTWLMRNTFDAEAIYANCEGVSGDWLLSGQGDMLKDTSDTVVPKENDTDRLNNLIDTIATLQEVINAKSETIAILTERIKQLEKQE